MTKTLFVFIVSLFLNFIVKSQTIQIYNNNLDYSFVVLSDTILKPINNFDKQSKSDIQISYYPDSILPNFCFAPKTIHNFYCLSENSKIVDSTMDSFRSKGIKVVDSSISKIANNSSGIITDSLITYNQWPSNFPITEYRLISIKNTSSYEQRLFYTYLKTDPSFRFVINKILVFMQARDEKGIWKDIISAEELENKSYASVRKMKAFEQINLVVKVPQGDFETDIRYKLLVNAPPNYPIDLFIYSNSFKGRISESSLSKK